MFSILGPDSPTLIPSRGNPSTVDFVLSKAINGISDPVTINALSSDHLPIIFSVPFNSPTTKDCRIFNYAKANRKKFRQTLEASVHDLKSQFSIMDTEQKIDECVEKISDHIHAAINKSVSKKFPYRFRYAYSPEIYNLTKNWNFYRRKFKETLDPAFRSIANQLSRIIKSQTAQLNQRTFDEKVAKLELLDNSLYRFAKTLKCKKSNVPPLVTQNATKAYSNKDKSNLLAKGFLGCHQTTSAMKSKKEKNREKVS
jgi:hypothetical protein